MSRTRPPPATLFSQQIFDDFLPQREVRLLFDEPLDFDLIRFLVGLGPRAVHRRAFAAIEHAELNAGGVDRPAHRAAEGVDLADDLPLGDAADRRVAAHLADGVAIGRQQRGARPQPRGRQRRLGAGMAGADRRGRRIRTHFLPFPQISPAAAAILAATVTAKAKRESVRI